MHKIRLILLMVVVLVASVEAGLRLFVGLGNPPLLQTDETIEYMFKPNQDLRRFGNRIKINEYGMRSENFSDGKSDVSEFRVMVYGDSVINGGNQTDHTQLATELVKANLALVMTDRKIVVGNVSAGSWGPPNILSYIRKFGFFDADVVIIMLSSHDYADVPTFRPLNPNTHPTSAPSLAILEAVTRYLPRLFPVVAAPQQNELDISSDLKDIDICLDALRDILILSEQSGAKTAIVQHWTQAELKAGKSFIGMDMIARIAEESGIPVYNDRYEMEKSIALGRVPYRDDIHLNAIGQGIIGKIFEKIIRSFIAS